MSLSLFDLNKEFKSYTITATDGQTMEVCVRAVDHASNMKLLQLMDEKRAEITIEMSEEKSRSGLRERIAEQSIQSLIDGVMQLERPTVEANADLAPGEDELTPAQQEAAALARWDTKRRQELAEITREALQDLLFLRQTTLMSQAKLVDAFTDIQLEQMIVDPKTFAPMLSSDRKAVNYVGKLMPATRKALMDVRQEFLDGLDEKSIRRLADDGHFLSSGESQPRLESGPPTTIESPSESPAG